MKALEQLKRLARHGPMTVVEGGAPLMPRHSARDARGHRWFSTRPVNPSSKSDAIAPTPTTAPTSATDQRELLIGQCHRVLRFVLFGIMFYLYRLHVVHLRRITDRFVRKNSLSDPGGGLSRSFLTLAA